MSFDFEKFKILRKEKKISVQSLAEKIGKSKKTIWTWEKGMITPSNGDINLMAKVLNISTYEISDIKSESGLSNFSFPETLLSEDQDVEKEFGLLSANQKMKILQLKDNLKKIKIENIKIKGELSKLMNVVDSLKLFLYVKDSDLRIKKNNRAFSDYVNLEKEELYNAKFSDIFGFKDKTLSQLRLIEQYVLSTGNEVNNEKIIIPGSDGERTGYLSVTPFSMENDKITEIFCTIQDVTNLDRALEKQNMLEDSIHSIHDGIWIMKLKPLVKYLFIGNAVKNIFDTELSDFFNNPHLWKNFLHPDDKLKVISNYDEIVKLNKFPAELEFRIMLPGNKIKWIRNKIYKFQEKDIIFGVLTDISEEFENKMRNELMRIAAKQFKDVYWMNKTGEFDEKFDSYYEIGDFGKKLSGYENNEKSSWLDIIHVDDRERVVKERKIKKRFPKSYEYRILCKDGRIRDVKHLEYCTEFYGEKIYFGIIRDITKQFLDSKQLLLLKKAIKENDESLLNSQYKNKYFRRKRNINL